MNWKLIGYIMLAIGVGILLWGLLTWYANAQGAKQIALFGDANDLKYALVVYDPDPFYELDQQVCDAMAEELSMYDWRVKVASVAAIEAADEIDVDLYIFCTNTYNWQPDQAVVNYIRDHEGLEQQAVVSVTLGSGSTKRAQRLLREELERKNVQLVSEDTFWLMRPNDDARMGESNVQVALDQAKNLITNTLYRLDHFELANDTFQNF